MERAVAAAAFCLIFLNGATDAFAAIASAVSSGALTMRRAALLAAMGNLAGGLIGARRDVRRLRRHVVRCVPRLLRVRRALCAAAFFLF